MDIVKAKKEDINGIMEVIQGAKKFLRSMEVDQWQGEEPNRQMILKDIEDGDSYLVKDGSKVVASFYFGLKGEETYEKIYEGNWIYQGQYITIHRMAVHPSYGGKGIGQMIFNYIEDYGRKNKIGSIRIDTHRDNKPMQGLIKKFNYNYCGIIYLLDGDERLAYEKLL